MGWTPFQWLIVALMLVTGSLNTLIAKWTDKLTAVGRDDGAERPFNHSFVQACTMFIGEFLCLGAFFVSWLIKRKRNQGFVEDAQSSLGDDQPAFTWKKAYVFLPPALCDMTATSVMYVGLNLTYASSFQMLRGAVIVFTALLSVAFLNRTISWSKWIGMYIVIAGLAVVGVSDILFGNNDNTDSNAIITGDLLIILAQIIAACQMVYEEKFLGKYNVPALVAVGLEGFFGFTVLALLLIPMSYLPAGTTFGVPPSYMLEDSLDAFKQMANNHMIILGLVGTIFSIAFFNYAGVTVTKEISATTRMVLDSMRTLVIWIVSLAVKWQDFFYLQVIGFILLILGMALYNDVLNRNLYVKIKRRFVKTEDGETLVDGERTD